MRRTRDSGGRTPQLFVAAFVALILGLSAGCATQRVEIDDNPYSETRLFVTRAGSDVTLSWESRPDLAYTIFYNHTRRAGSPWKVLPGFDRIRGTGRMLSYTDRVRANETRYYRLKAYPAVAITR